MKQTTFVCRIATAVSLAIALMGAASLAQAQGVQVSAPTSGTYVGDYSGTTSDAFTGQSFGQFSFPRVQGFQNALRMRAGSLGNAVNFCFFGGGSSAFSGIPSELPGTLSFNTLQSCGSSNPFQGDIALATVYTGVSSVNGKTWVIALPKPFSYATNPSLVSSFWARAQGIGFSTPFNITSGGMWIVFSSPTQATAGMNFEGTDSGPLQFGLDYAALSGNWSGTLSSSSSAALGAALANAPKTSVSALPLAAKQMLRAQRARMSPQVTQAFGL